MTRVSARTLIFYMLAAISLVLLVLSTGDRLAPVEGLFGRVTRPFLLVFNNTGRDAQRGRQRGAQPEHLALAERGAQVPGRHAHHR